MEKQRVPPGPKPRLKRVLPPPGDFIALGKASGPKQLESKPAPNVAQRKLQSAAPTTGFHREKRTELSPVNIGPSKSTKQSRVLSPSPVRAKEVIFAKSFEGVEALPSVKIIDVAAQDLEYSVMIAADKGDHEQVDGLICGALKTLKVNRLKPDPMVYLSLTNIVKHRPELFLSSSIVEHLLQFLRREQPLAAVKLKASTLLSIMSCNILQYAFQYELSWPVTFVKVYVEDALGDRSWVDNEHNVLFVRNIIASFGTILPKRQSLSALPSAGKANQVLISEQGQSACSATGFEEERSLDDSSFSFVMDEATDVLNRYSQPKDEQAIQAYIYDVARDQLNKRQVIDSASRNLLRFLTSVCGYSEVRLRASQRLETWLQNPKLTRPAQELLMSVALNCKTHLSDDIEVIGNLVRMRLKSKPVTNYYLEAMREVLHQHRDNLGTMLKHIIFNELSQQRNPNNMLILGHIFQAEPENAARYLALVFQDLLANREDYLRALRSLLREIVRSLKYEVNLVAFCRGLMQDRQELLFTTLEQQYKDRMLAAVIDLICMTSMLNASPVVKDLWQALSKGEKRDYSVLREFQTQISTIQRDSVWFFHTKVLPMYTCAEKDFVCGLNKILFLELPVHYYSKDNWPPENERATLLTMMKEVPLAEDALLRLHLLGLQEEFPINCADAMDIIEKMVLRSANLASGIPGLEILKPEVVRMLLSLSAYNHPKEIPLPAGYVPPTLAISTLYWKAWLILLVLVAANPSSIGWTVWDTYPSMKCLMEMVITGNYDFPPLAAGDSSVDVIKSNELQISRAEADDILVFEGHLAAATSGQTVTKSNSLLITQLISLDPIGDARQPPAGVIEKLKMLNKALGLGCMLCKSRNPDFLLSIIQSQGSSRSMPWLADLVHSSEDSLSALPVQCLCEFLLMKHGSWDSELRAEQPASKDKQSIRPKVIARLQDLLLGSEATMQSCSELVKYFVNRWSSAEMRDRDAAIQGFQSIILQPPRWASSVSSEDVGADVDETSSLDVRHRRSRGHLARQVSSVGTNSYEWLHDRLPRLVFFDNVLPDVIYSMKQALYVEMDVPRLQAYILFLSKHWLRYADSAGLVEDISQFIISRSTIVSHVICGDSCSGREAYGALLDLFYAFIQSRMKPVVASDDWQENPEIVCVTWGMKCEHAGNKSDMHIQVIHATVLLLSRGPAGDRKSYQALVEMWFPTSGSVEISRLCNGEVVEMLPSWLRTLLLRSDVPKLVDAGLTGHTPAQLLVLLQASGFPVESLSKILMQLDQICVSDPTAIDRASIDKDSIVQVTEIAWSRGASGGKAFCSFLLQEEYLPKDEELTLDEVENLVELPSLQCGKVEASPMDTSCASSLSADFVSVILAKLFCSGIGGLNILVLADYMSMLQQLSVEIAKRASHAEDSLLMTTTRTLIQLLDDDKFVEGFAANAGYAAALLRLILSGQDEENVDVLRKLASSLLRVNAEKRELKDVISALTLRLQVSSKSSSQHTTVASVLRALASEELQSETLEPLVLVAVEILRATTSEDADEPTLTPSLLVNACRNVLRSSKFMFEAFVKALCSYHMRQGSDPSADKAAVRRRKCVNLLVALLKSDLHIESGLLIDWLEVLDPEIASSNPAEERGLLFAERDELGNKAIDKVGSCTSPYLLSVLAHDAKNSTLEGCLEWILGGHAERTRLKASSCLDLIDAVVYNPRLWTGQDAKKSSGKACDMKKTAFDVDLDLTVPQLVRMIELILLEMSAVWKKSLDRKGVAKIMVQEQSHQGRSLGELVEKRLSLLLSYACARSAHRLHAAVSFVRRFKHFDEDVVDSFLRQLYLRKPNLLLHFGKEVSLSTNVEEIFAGKETEVDQLVHRLILSVSEPDGSSAWEEKFQNVNSIIRRIAVQHPLLILRQVPVLLSLVLGKSRFSPADFKYSNQLMFCSHVLNLVDLLRPYVFMTSQLTSQVLCNLVDSFVELIQSPCLSGADLVGLAGRFIDFLNHLIASGSKSAHQVLKKHAKIFVEMQYDFPSLQGIASVTTFISACSSSQSDYEPSSLLSSSTSPWNDVQLSTFRRRLSERHHFKDLLGVIHDLDEASKRRVEILEHFIEELAALVSFESPDVREKAHLMLLRHFRHQPKGASQLVHLYMACLDSGSDEVCQTAAKFLPKFIVLCDDACGRMLGKVFTKAIGDRPDLEQCITQCIRNLNSDF